MKHSSNTEAREEEASRKQFVAPKLEQHPKLPVITGVSGSDICDVFPTAPGCMVP